MRARHYLALIKPRVTFVALLTTLLGYLFALTGPLDFVYLFHVLMGSWLVGGGSTSLNQYFERDIDARMKRTENRPIPSGNIKASHALWLGVGMALLGLAQLAFFVNYLTALLGGLTLASYIACYTPLKRLTVLNTYVGAIPGALPTLMGWAAAAGELSSRAFVLFFILFLWQFPHFFAIAWVYRDDYRKGGLLMLSQDDAKGLKTAWSIMIYSIFLTIVSLLPTWAGMTGMVYFWTAIFLGTGLVLFSVFLLLDGLNKAKLFVNASIYYLLILIAVMIGDKL